jgi:uncharacterized protein
LDSSSDGAQRRLVTAASHDAALRNTSIRHPHHAERRSFARAWHPPAHCRPHRAGGTINLVEPDGAARQSFLDGIELFNRGDFFEAHEAMEEAMDRAEGDGDWEFFLGLLRAAVANHKLGQGEISSAILHLQAALRFLSPYPDRHQAIKLRELRYGLSAQLGRLIEIRDRGAAGPIPPAPRIEFASPACY